MAKHALAAHWESGTPGADKPQNKRPQLEIVSFDLPDEQLVAILQGKDGPVSREEAFDFLYQRHAPHVLRRLRGFGLSGADQEDLTQEIFVQVLQGIQNFKAQGGSKFSTWLFRIATNAALTFFRRHRVRSIVESDTDADGMTREFQDPRQPTPLDELLGHELGERVAALVAEKPKLAQAVHFYVRGYTHPQTSRVLHIPEGTAKSRIFLARQAIEAMLAEDEGGGKQEQAA